MSFIQEQLLIHQIKSDFQRKLSDELNLTEIMAPLFFEEGTGEQDELSGNEESVSFQSKSLNKRYEIVHSLAKWKRAVVSKYQLPEHSGILTNMNAIRAQEEHITDIHSMHVDQWDWECVIPEMARDTITLKRYVNAIYSSILFTAKKHSPKKLVDDLPDSITFIHSEDLLTEYPNNTAKEREHLIAKKHGAVFIVGIGGELKNGQVHDHRSSDYDDWTTLDNHGRKGLNGDLIVWCPTINQSLELSSMGIRVDDKALKRQLKLKDENLKLEQKWHKKLLNGDFKQTIGGGIGQSRMIMFIGQFNSIHDFKPFRY